MIPVVWSDSGNKNRRKESRNKKPVRRIGITSGALWPSESMGKRAGFTLLELPVVIAVITLLMSILLPALDRAKAQAKEVTCLSNLHQWYLVFVMYANDWNNSFMEGNVGGDEDQPVQWYNVARPYCSEPELLLCPAASKPAVPAPGGPEPHGGSFKAWGVFNGDIWPYAGTYGSYGINSWAQNPTGEIEYSDQQGLDHYCWRRPGVKGAGYAPLLLDANWIDGWPLHTDTPPPTRDTFPHDSAPNMWRFCIDRHVGKVNGVFVDGTNRKMGLKALWRIRWHREWPAVDLETIEWPEWMENVGEDF